MVEFNDLATLVSAAENELRRRGAVVPRTGGNRETARRRDGETERPRAGETEGGGDEQIPASGGHKSNGTHQANGKDHEPQNQEPNKQEAKSAWTPSDRDEIVYDRVRYRGESQSHVALELGIAQGTVSRIVQRYDRWLARAEPRAGGRLDHEERHRLQRCLTYELNQRLLASCLRIASAMEGFIDVSKTTITRERGLVGDESQARTTHATLDRSGIASRFLRLAFRINMEQLKLAAMEPLEALSPLSPAELDQFEGEDDRGGAAAWPSSVVGKSEATADVSAVQQEAVEQEIASQEVAPHESAGRDMPSASAPGAHKRIPPDDRATTDVPNSYEAQPGLEKSADYARIAPPPAAKVGQPPPQTPRVFYGGMPSDDDPSWGAPRKRIG